MGVIFISHHHANSSQAVRIRDWLRAGGWNETFLDLDPARGIAPGQRWQDELKKAGERCSAIVVLISPEWTESKWCQVEFLLASQLGKLIFGVMVTPTTFAALPVELTGHYQIADISGPAGETDGLDALAVGLKRAGLAPEDFPWPPPDDASRDPYRGLRAMDEDDAAIFFGRDAAITRGLDALRRMRDGAAERMLVVLGASGTGKSSFLKAGLLARLRRDQQNFILLPTLRPERAALTGPQGLLHALGLPAASGAEALQARFAAVRDPVVGRLARFAEAARESHHAKPPTLVLPVDQAEELFATDGAESEAALDLVRDAFAADENFLAVVTIRSDAYARLQSEPRLAGVPRCPFDLPPLSRGAFKDVIEGPGRLATPKIAFEPALTDRLIEDLDEADALPLLAFTLEKLIADYGRHGRLAVDDYERGVGGLEGAISKAVAAAFAAAGADTSLPATPIELDTLARRAMIPWLVRVDDAEAAPKRRIAVMRELPCESTPLVRHLVDQRLLVSDVRDGDVTVEVSHEAVLRHWPALSAWIAAERSNLLALEAVRVAASEWPRHRSARAVQSSESWLVHRGDRLVEAEQLLERPDYARILAEDGRAYLAACRARQDAEAADADRRRRERQARAMTALARSALQDKPQHALLLAATAMERLGALDGASIADAAAIRTIVSGPWGQPVSEIGADLEAVRVAADGRYAARLRDETVMVWPLGERGVTGEPLVFAVPPRRYPQLRWAGPRLIVEGDEGAGRVTRVLSVTERDGIAEFSRLEGSLVGASPDGAMLVIRQPDHTNLVRVSGVVRDVARLPAQHSVAGVAFSQDGVRVVMCDEAGSAMFRLAGSRDAPEVQMESRMPAGLACHFSPDGRWLFHSTSSAENSIWSLSDSNEAKAWCSFGGRGMAIAEFSPDSRWLAFVGWHDMYQDEYVQLFRLGTASRAPHRLRQIEEIDSLAFSADARWLVSASRHDDNAFAWDLRTLANVEPECANRALSPIPLGGHGGGVQFLTFAGSTATIVTLSIRGVLRQFELEKQTSKRGSELEIWRVAPSSPVTLRGHDRPISKWAISANARTLLTGADSEPARLWRLPAQAPAMVDDIAAEARRLAARPFTREERERIDAEIQES